VQERVLRKYSPVDKDGDSNINKEAEKEQPVRPEEMQESMKASSEFQGLG
jgi:hypothetical protein